MSRRSQLLVFTSGSMRVGPRRRRRKRTVQQHLELPGYGDDEEMLASCACEHDEAQYDVLTGQPHLGIPELPLPKTDDDEDLVEQLVKRNRRSSSISRRGFEHLEQPGWDLSE